MSDPRKRRRPSKARVLREIAQKRLGTERHLQMPIADWRVKKRQEWRHVMRALELFTYGCAYTPAGNDLYELQKAADRIKAALAEEWICW